VIHVRTTAPAIDDWMKRRLIDITGLRSVMMVFLSTLLVNQLSYAQTCCSGGVPLSANIGLPGAEVGALQFSLSYDYNQLRTLKSGSEELKDRLRERITHSVLLQTGYTFNNRFSADLVLSFVRQERNIFTPFATNSTVTNGLGDGVLLIKYNFLPENIKATFLVGVGPKIPFGSTNKVTENGIALPADLQPGSGSWDAVFWSSFSHSLAFRPSMSFIATATYRASGVNPDYLGSIAYQFGNELQIITGIADKLVIGNTIWDPSVSFRYRNAQRDKNNGVEIEATGGEWVFLLPGLTYTVNRAISVNFFTEIPLYSFVNNAQLTPTNRFTLGVYYKINKRQ